MTEGDGRLHAVPLPPAESDRLRALRVVASQERARPRPLSRHERLIEAWNRAWGWLVSIGARDRE